MALPKYTLGKTGLEVTQLGYGAFELRGPRHREARPLTDEEAARILNETLDAGINFIDTAPGYGPSEYMIGRHIGHRRSECYIATKCGAYLMYAGEMDKGFPGLTREHILRGVYESLQKMRTDYIDILQTHNLSPADCRDNGIVEVMQELKQRGAVRFIAASVHPFRPEFDEFIEMGVFDAFQIQYSALDRRREDLIVKAGDTGAGIIIRSGVAFGEPGEAKGRRSEDMWRKFDEAKLDELRDPEDSRTAFLLRFVLAHPYCQTAIIGTLQPKHLAENARVVADRGPLAADVVEEVKTRLTAVGVAPGE